MLPRKLLLLVDDRTGVEFHRRIRDANQDRRAAPARSEMSRPAGGNDLLHGHLVADAVESVVHAGDRRAPCRPFVRPLHEGVYLFHRIALSRVDAVGRPEALGEREFVVVDIHRDDRVCAAHAGAAYGGQADAADAENRNAFPFLHVGRIEHRAGAGHDRAADDGGHVLGDVVVRFHHVLMIGEGMICPGEDVLRNRGAAGQLELSGRWRVLDAGGVFAVPRSAAPCRLRPHG